MSEHVFGKGRSVDRGVLIPVVVFVPGDPDGLGVAEIPFRIRRLGDSVSREHYPHRPAGAKEKAGEDQRRNLLNAAV